MGISHTTDLIAASPRQRCCKDGSSHSQPAERPWEHLHCSHSPKQSPCKVQNSRLWRATRLLERYREGNHPRSGSRCAACACGLPITIHPENPHRDVHRKRGNVQRHVHLCWKKTQLSVLATFCLSARFLRVRWFRTLRRRLVTVVLWAEPLVTMSPLLDTTRTRARRESSFPVVQRRLSSAQPEV